MTEQINEFHKQAEVGAEDFTGIAYVFNTTATIVVVMIVLQLAAYFNII